MNAMKDIGSTYIRFNKIVSKIFECYNFTIDETQLNESSDNFFDICARKNKTGYLIDVKFPRANRVYALELIKTADRLSYFTNIQKSNIQKCDIQKCDIQNFIPVLIVSATINPKLRQKIQESNVIVIDIQNLLFLVNDNYDLKNKLLSILEFSVNDILPEKPNTDIFEVSDELPVYEQTKKGVNSKAESLLARISQWDSTSENARRESSEYETLCNDILQYLFNDELSLWYKQQKSNDDLYRFDLICKIKDGNVSGLWTTILQCFNSKYIIFEFKNYTAPITQKEVYTTDKYLYLKALRGVAIIISCKGASSNANKAIRGTLRENGKLILSINNKDLGEMIKIKMNEGVPADYLYSKFDELLINLEK